MRTFDSARSHEVENKGRERTETGKTRVGERTPSPQEKVKNPARLGAQRGCSKVKRDSLPEGSGGLASIERCLETRMDAKFL